MSGTMVVTVSVTMPRRFLRAMVMMFVPMVVRMGMRVGVVVIVRMGMVVGMIVMVMACGCHDWLEHFFGLLERDVVALEHLTYGEVVLDQ